MHIFRDVIIRLGLNFGKASWNSEAALATEIVSWRKIGRKKRSGSEGRGAIFMYYIVVVSVKAFLAHIVQQGK